jgi:hypothetical protein
MVPPHVELGFADAPENLQRALDAEVIVSARTHRIVQINRVMKNAKKDAMGFDVFAGLLAEIAAQAGG